MVSSLTISIQRIANYYREILENDQSGVRFKVPGGVGPQEAPSILNVMKMPVLSAVESMRVVIIPRLPTPWKRSSEGT